MNGPSTTPAQALAGYQASIQFIAHDAKVIWDSFRSLLAANTVLIAFAGLALELYPEAVWLALVLGILGLMVCVAWSLITVRCFDFYKYHFSWARRYEFLALGSDDHVVQVGKEFAEGNAVEGVAPPRLRWLSRLFRVEYLMHVVIAGYFAIYLFLIFGSAP